MEGPAEGQKVGAPGVVADELDGGFHALGARVAEEDPVAPAQFAHEPLRQGEGGLVGEVGEADVGEALRLGPDRLHHLGVGVARGVHRDAGHEVQEEVAVHVF